MIPPFLYENLLRPLFFQIDPERIHHFVIQALKGLAYLPLPAPGATRDPRLERTVCGLKFPNPVGLAAGLDKEAEALSAWQKLGFGFVEAGTITALEQPGNPQPRLFRYPKQEALINRMGFNNSGAEAVAQRLETLNASGRWPKIPVGINIGKSKVTPLEEAVGDYLRSFERLFPYGDFFILNVSSPNTPGLRHLQGKEELDELLHALTSANRGQSVAQSMIKGADGPTVIKPLFLKIAPDLEWAQLDEILELCAKHGLDRNGGIVATNTTLDHSSIPESRDQPGGLSGGPLKARSTEIIRYICRQTVMPVIGAGGIFSAEDALEKFDAGASLVELYTGFVYRGPALVEEICRALCPPPVEADNADASATGKPFAS